MSRFPWSEKLGELQREAALKRAKGDSLRRQGKDIDADEEFRKGIGFLERALDTLGQSPSGSAPGPGDAPALPEEELARVRELIEAHGARAGLLRRIGESTAALAGYSKGADLERRFVPESTYNRTNEIKYGLLTGVSTLADLSSDIMALERHMTQSLNEHPELGDDGWAWADLGDLRALCGDAEGAERAYRAFIAKAKPTAPRTTLDVLGSILEILERTNDAQAATVRQSLEFVRGKLNLR